jgi:membrane associated rhomboid family serine protease
MLEDRDYMRESSGPRWSATVILLVTNIVVYVLQLTVFPKLFNIGYLELSLEGLKHGFVWQLLTFQFLHGSTVHILFNSLALFFFGRAVESLIGRTRFFQLYLLSGVAGGLLQVLLALLLPSHFGGSVVGASAGVSGLIAAFAVMNWQNSFTMLFYFFPIQMRGRTLFWLSIALALVGMMTPGSYVAHAAHLGGFLAGFGFIRLGIGRRHASFDWHPFENQKRKRRLVRAVVTKIPGWPAKDAISADLPEEEFISKEVDPILEKISAHGIQSLTQRERDILERARNKMGKR